MATPEADRDARTLVDLGALAGQLGDGGHDLGHVTRHFDPEPFEVGGHGLLDDDIHFGGGVERVVGADLGPEAVLQRRDDAPSAGVVLGVGRSDEEDVEREPDLVAADLDVPLLEHVQQADLDAFGQVRQLVDGEDAAVGARHEAVMERQLVREVAPLGHLDRVDFADEVGDRGVRRGQLLPEALVAAHPLDRAFVALGGHELAAVAGDRVVGVVEHFRAGDDGEPFVQQVGQAPHDPGLGLAPFTEENDVVPRQQGVLQGRQDRAVIADQASDTGRPAAMRAATLALTSCLTGRDRQPEARSWPTVEDEEGGVAAMVKPYLRRQRYFAPNGQAAALMGPV